MKSVIARKLGATKYFGVGIYCILFVLLGGLLLQQILTRKHGDFFYLKAEIQPGSLLFWNSGHEIIVPPYAADPTISGNDFIFKAWNGAALSLDLFASPNTPLQCNDQHQIGNEQKDKEAANNTGVAPDHPTLYSHHMRISSESPIKVRLELDFNSGMVRFHRGFVELAYYRPRSDSDAADANGHSMGLSGSNPIHRFGIIEGQDGSPFTLVTNDSKGERECAGTFKKYRGEVLLTRPRKYLGEGAYGIARLIVQDTPKAVDFPLSFAKPVQGINILAFENATISMGLPIKKVSMGGFKDMQITYRGALNPVGDSDTFDALFDKKKSGKFVVDGRENHVVISGSVDRIKVNDKDIAPRSIEEWPWYIQMLFGMIIGFVAERAFISLGRLLYANQSLNSGFEVQRNENVRQGHSSSSDG